METLDSHVLNETMKVKHQAVPGIATSDLHRPRGFKGGRGRQGVGEKGFCLHPHELVQLKGVVQLPNRTRELQGTTEAGNVPSPNERATLRKGHRDIEVSVRGMGRKKPGSSRPLLSWV